MSASPFAVTRRRLFAAPALLLAPAACAAAEPGLPGLLPDGPYHPGAALTAYRARDQRTFEAARGDIGLDTPYFAASSTKLYVTALLLQSVQDGRIDLDAPFRRYLSGPETQGLNTFGGQDRTGAITLRQLMAHTSGLPDFFEPDNSRTGLFAELTQGRDRALTFPEAMDITRRLGAHAPPGAQDKAVYSDANYQVLGKVIEAVEGAPFADVFRRRIAEPLSLQATWVYSDPADTRPRPLRFREAEMRIPRYMAFTQADGGVVTTAREALAFVRAFYEGRLFDRSRLAALQDFRPMFFPLEYGTGMMRFQLPSAMTGFRKLPPLIGHSGLSGAVIFHSPESGLFLAGTVNQVDRRSAAYQLLARAALALEGAA
ncbi:MAG: hypothetical protein RL588_1956 [Pseudomonadota bacterium]|jgi:CubicO group peptidase (beta-lactamase class C family)